jgi:hypothetical protein
MEKRFRWAGMHPLAAKAIVQRQRDEADRLERLQLAAEEDGSLVVELVGSDKAEAERCRGQ